MTKARRLYLLTIGLMASFVLLFMVASFSPAEEKKDAETKSAAAKAPAAEDKNAAKPVEPRVLSTDDKNAAKPAETSAAEQTPPLQQPGQGMPGNYPMPGYEPPPQENTPPTNVSPSAADEKQSPAEAQKKISLDLKGIDITELFRILSLKMGLSIVPSKSVSGRVNIYLNNVSLDDALDIILISQELAAVRRGSIITIMTAAEYEKTYGKKYNEKREFATIRLTYAKPSAVFNVLSQIKSDIGKIIVDESTGTILLIDIPEKLALEKKTILELDQPLETTIIDLKYSKSADMKSHISSAITTGPGELMVDERTGKMAISDLPDKISKIKQIVKAFDSPPLQVFIEAEIVQLTLDKQFQSGINWDKVLSEEQWIKWAKLVGLHLTGTYMLPALAASTATAQTVSIGQTAPNTYSALLKFLQTYGNTKVLSSPRIAVINNQEARILVGVRQAYIVGTQSQSQLTTITADNVQFIDVGVKLSVVPTINTEGFITMKIKPEISSVQSTLTTASGTTVPIVATSEAETVVKVKDGTMIMIAGLFTETKTDAVNGLPFLAKIPIIGLAFSSKNADTKREELIVFLTPRIITGEMALPGTEPEENIPPDMINKKLSHDIIQRQISNITTKGVSGEKGQASPEVIIEKGPPTLNIDEKMKGLKSE